MKTRILAVLLAVCMIAGSCVLFASAAEWKDSKETYVNAGYYWDDLSNKTYADAKLDISSGAVKSASGVPKTHTIKVKEEPTLSILDTKITKDNVDQVLEFDPKFDSNVFEVSSIKTTDGYKITVSVQAEQRYAYQIKSTLEDEKGTGDHSTQYLDCSDKTVSAEKVSAHTIKGADTDVAETDKGFIKTFEIKEKDIERIEKLVNITVGLRFYGDSGYKNLSASEIAQIEAKYDNKTVHVNTIPDVAQGTPIVLTASLKDPDKDGKDYRFKCWVDSDGKVLSKDPTFKDNKTGSDYIAGQHANPIYAVFEELKSRIRINYSSDGNGTIAYQDETSTNKVVTRSLLKSDDGQLSVMEGHKVKFVFTPDEGYEVAHVYVDRTGADGEKDVASFLTIMNPGESQSWWNALKVLINATNKDTYSYTFGTKDLTGFPNQIRSIRVVFQRIENFTDKDGNPVITGWELEPHAQLEPIKAEGLELETGAAAAAAANGGEANPAGAAAGGTTLPAEDGAAGSGASAISGVINPATGSTGAIAVFAALFAAAGVAVVTVKKKED